MSRSQHKVFQEQIAALKQELRRDGFNRGIRAALRIVEGWSSPHIRSGAPELAETADQIRNQLRKLVKPPLKEGKYGILAVKR